MIKFLKLGIFFIFIFFINNCSFQNSGGFFKSKIEQFEKELERKNSILVFSPQKNLKKKFQELF